MGNTCGNKPRAIINSQYYIETLSDPKQTECYNKGRTYQYKGQYESAVNCFYQAIQHNPESSMSYNGIANCHLKKGNLNDAMNFYKKATEINPNNKFAFNGLGTCYDNLNDFSSAINNFNRAITIDKDFSYPHNGLGNLYYANQRYSQSLPNYENAVRLSPNNPIFHANLACNYAMLGRMDEAFKQFDKAKASDFNKEAELSPGNKYYLAGKFMEFQRAAASGDRKNEVLQQNIRKSASQKRIPIHVSY